jgi:hypothetical protein
MPSEYFGSSGRRLTLSGAGAAGGEGTVWEVDGHPDLAAKIYHPGRGTTEMFRKLTTMLAAAPADPTIATRRHRSIAWPTEILFADPGRRTFAGFVMPRLDRSTFREAHGYYDTVDRVGRFGGAYTWRHLFIAAHNLTSAVAAVHEQGHRVGDLRETNILVAPNSLVSLIDCDSFEIHGNGGVFYTRVGSGEYLPPELHSVDLASGIDRYHSDLFALAVLIFRLLMLGSHPYQARGAAIEDAPSIEAKIIRGLFPHKKGSRLAPPDFAPPFSVLQPRIRALFLRAFGEGHGNPELRPSANEWFQALSDAGPRLKACRSNEHHWFGHHLWRCPWCRFASRMSRDPFPREVSIGSQLTVAAAQSRVPKSDRREHLRTLVSLALVDGELSAQETNRLSIAASELGVHRPEMALLIADERRKAKPLWDQNGKQTDVATRERPSAKSTPRKVLTKNWVRTGAALAPFALLVTMAAFLAPITGLAVSVLLIAPLLATTRDLRKPLELARAVPTIFQSMTLALYHFIPAALWAAPAVLLGFVLVRFGLVGSSLATRVVCAGLTTWWWVYLLQIAGGREPYPFVSEVRRVVLRTVAAMWKGVGDFLRFAAAPVIVAGLLGALAVRGVLITWPIG